MTDLAASTIRYHSTALTFTVTLSRVIVSCCSAETVRVRMSIFTERSIPSGMIQYKPGPRSPSVTPEPEHHAALILLGDAESREKNHDDDTSDY